MDSLQAPVEAPNDKNADKKEENDASAAKIASMITPEQVLSASVARKRRNLSKRSTNRTRDVTPGREIAQQTPSDEEIAETRPKTPERRRRRSDRLPPDKLCKRSESLNMELYDRDSNKVEFPVVSKNLNPSEQANNVLNQNGAKRDSLVSITQAEFMSVLNKAKRSLTLNKESKRHKKIDKSAAKRSQSAPNTFNEEELLEKLKKAQLEAESNNTRAHTKRRKNSTDSVRSTSSEDTFKPKPYRPIVRQFVEERKKQRRQSSEKIVEILDPNTSEVVAKISKGSKKSPFRFMRFFGVFKIFPVITLYKEYQHYKIEMKNEYDKIRKLRSKCISDLIIIMIYCGLGGIVFKFIEGTFENFYKCGVKRVKRDFIDVLWTKSHNLREEDWKSLMRNRLRVFEEELHVAHEAGMTSYSGQRSWSFLNGVVYSLTVVTTIGYGHMAPTTTAGRVITIVYSIIGIPLFLIALTDFGKLFTRCIKFVWAFVRRMYYTGSCKKVRKTTHVEDFAQAMYEIATLRRPSMFVTVDPENPKAGPLTSTTFTSDVPTTPAISNFEIDDEFNLPISVAIVILILYILLGAVMYCFFERWDFFASFYFVFISMSTIGFGDYVPRHPVCMIVSIVYLMFGLALMSMCINVVQVKLSNTFKDASAKLGATIGLTMDNEDGSVNTVPPPVVEFAPIHEGEEDEDLKGDEGSQKNGIPIKKEHKNSNKKSSLKL